MIRNPLTGAHTLRSFGKQPVFRCVLAIGVIAVLVVGVRDSFGQGKTQSSREYKIKAAYLYNFLRYIEWPADAFENASSPFVVGILGKAPPELVRSLAYYEKRKKVRGRAIKIRRFETAEKITDCHVVYLAKSLDEKLLKEAVKRLSGNPTLLVGETSNFLEQGGGISFFRVSTKIRFRLALKETQRKRLKPSAKLLQVAQVTD